MVFFIISFDLLAFTVAHISAGQRASLHVWLYSTQNLTQMLAPSVSIMPRSLFIIFNVLNASPPNYRVSRSLLAIVVFVGNRLNGY